MKNLLLTVSLFTSMSVSLFAGKNESAEIKIGSESLPVAAEALPQREVQLLEAFRKMDERKQVQFLKKIQKTPLRQAYEKTFPELDSEGSDDWFQMMEFVM